MQLATGMGLCSKENCGYYGQLNPFRRYGGKTDELIRQSFLHGETNGWVHSNGTISMTHQTFRIYSNREDYLICAIAHELAHVTDNHAIEKHKELSVRGQNDSEEDKKLIEAQISQDYEHKSAASLCVV